MKNKTDLAENNEKVRARMISILVKMDSDFNLLNKVNDELGFILDDGSNEQVKQCIKQMLISSINITIGLSEAIEKTRLLRDIEGDN